MEWGTNAVINYGNGALDFDGSTGSGKTGLQFLNGNDINQEGSTQYAPNVTFVTTNVPSTPAVPEPATATLSLLALAGLAARRRRK